MNVYWFHVREINLSPNLSSAGTVRLKSYLSFFEVLEHTIMSSLCFVCINLAMVLCLHSLNTQVFDSEFWIFVFENSYGNPTKLFWLPISLIFGRLKYS